MKSKIIIGIWLISVGLSSCVRPAGDVDFNQPDLNQIATAIKIIDASITPVGGESLPTYTADPNATKIESGTETPDGDSTTEILPIITIIATEITVNQSATPVINTVASTATPEPDQPISTTSTVSPPTATSVGQQLPAYAPFDPIASYGGPRYEENFKNSDGWQANNGKLPDTEFLKFSLVNEGLRVQGKYQDFDTWFYTAPTLNDFYIEMKVDSQNCSGDDAYGLILRGAEHNQPAHGYIVGISCEGDVFMRRIDGVNPYSALSLMVPTNSTLIATGKNQTNILGIMMEGEEISIYVNGYLFATVFDNEYLWGRYGLFVKPGPTENYSYVVNQIRIWKINQ